MLLFKCYSWWKISKASKSVSKSVPLFNIKLYCFKSIFVWNISLSPGFSLGFVRTQDQFIDFKNYIQMVIGVLHLTSSGNDVYTDCLRKNCSYPANQMVKKERAAKLPFLLSSYLEWLFSQYLSKCFSFVKIMLTFVSWCYFW